MFGDIEFSHDFQPIVDVDEGSIVSYEALLRGKNQEPPVVIFNQVGERSLHCFDQYNRERAISLAARLGIDCAINLNFLPSDILQDDGRCLTQTIDAFKANGLDPKQLVIEITESEVVEHHESLCRILNKVRREKISIAIDDFGAGYAGLNLLASIQPDILKIDMSLLRGISECGPRQAIVRAIYNMSIDLGIELLAEGVEQESEYNWLRDLGISLYQGYLFGKPEFERLPTVNELDFPIVA